MTGSSRAGGLCGGGWGSRGSRARDTMSLICSGTPN